MKPPLYSHIALLFALFFLSSACATSPIGPTAKAGQTAIGFAVYYSDAFHGKRTASGEPYNKDAMTAAHPSLPMGTLVRVTELTSRKSVVVSINDRGPFGDRSRIIDLSHAAAEALGMVRLGKAMVEVEVVELP